MSYEYKVVPSVGPMKISNLNSFGYAGWELAAILKEETGHYAGYYLYYFKRERK